MSRLLFPRILLIGLLTALALASALAEVPSLLEDYGYEDYGPYHEPRHHSRRRSFQTRYDGEHHVLVERKNTVPSTNAQTFKTEPIIEANTFQFVKQPDDPSVLAPGYFFFTVQGGYRSSRGAQIYDTAGNLVWYSLLGIQTQDLHVCDYLGEQGTHLCVHNWKPAKQIFNQSYHLVGRQWSSEKDSHEFNMLPGGRTFLTVGTHLKNRDITPYTGNPHGRVGDGCMLEIDVESLETVFQWCFLKHFPIWYTTLYPMIPGALGKENRSMASFKAGKGTTSSFWDFTHINSADKYDGDYIVSLRHTNSIVKFAGPENKHGLKPGSVLWTLGGYASDFELHNFNFSRQHHVRFVSVAAEETIISIFNNAWEGTNTPSSDRSDGQIIRLNNRTMKAYLVHDYPHPDGALSDSRGSMQILPNKNALVGFGRYPELIEYSENGTILYHVRFSRYEEEKLNEVVSTKNLDFSYRIVKQEWVGKPLQPPKLIAYSRTCSTNKDSPLIAYISWNGATEVKSWHFMVGTEKEGPWASAGIFDKDGFETVAILRSVEKHATKFTPWIAVDALDANGTVLRRVTQQVFVPRMPKIWDCDFAGCNKPLRFKYLPKKSRTCVTEITWLQIVFLAVFVCFVEASSSLMGRVWGRSWGANVPPHGNYQAVRAVVGDDVGGKTKPDAETGAQPNGNLAGRPVELEKTSPRSANRGYTDGDTTVAKPPDSPLIAPDDFQAAVPSNDP